jgi:hypothetical protein
MVAEINRWPDAPGDAPLGECASCRGRGLAGPWEALAAESSAQIVVGRLLRLSPSGGSPPPVLELRPNLSAAAGLASRGSMDPVVTCGSASSCPSGRSRSSG